MKTASCFLSAISFVQNAEAYQQQLAQAIRAQQHPAFLASLPETFMGYTQDEYQYWLEPAVKPLRPDSERLIFEGGNTNPNSWVANMMAPRFLSGVRFMVEEVLPGDELVEGGVYVAEIYERASGRHQGRSLFRHLFTEYRRGKQGCIRDCQRIQYDNDILPEPLSDRYGLPDFMCRQEGGLHEIKLYRFLHYESFAELVPATKAFPRRETAEWLERTLKSRQQQQAENDRRREARAKKKARQYAGGMGGPVLHFVPRQYPQRPAAAA